MYDPSIGRWHVMDPMVEDYLNLSSYNYCANNPIIFIDPNGMYIDEYGVDKDGYVRFIKKKEGPDELYKIDDQGNKIDINKDGQMTKGDDYITVDDNTILPSLKADQLKFNGDYASSKSLEDIGNVFLFAAANTNVEWGFSAFKKNEETTYVVATSHDDEEVENRAKINPFDEMDLTYDLHSHPSPTGTPGASYAGGVGDWRNVIAFYNRWIASGREGNEFPIHGVYHKYTNTIYYYTPWKRSIKGHTFE
jgi:JAB-like toxin  1